MWIKKAGEAAAIGVVDSLYDDLMYGDGDLTLAQREMIAVTVSALNACEH